MNQILSNGYNYGGLGFIVFVSAWLLCALAVLPLWSIIDVAINERPKESKALWILTILLMYPVIAGQFIYGFFGARSKGLRKTTIATTLLGLMVPTITTILFFHHRDKYVSESFIQATKAMQLRKAKFETISKSFTPQLAAEQSIDTFSALNLAIPDRFRSSVSLAKFDQNGIILNSAKPVPSDIIQFARDDKTGEMFVLTSHDFGVLRNKYQNFQKILLDGQLPRLSGAGAIAFIPKTREIIITTTSGDGYAYSYQVDSKSWKLLGKMQGIDIVGLVYEPTREAIYGLEDSFGSDYLNFLVQLSPAGAIEKRIALNPPIPSSKLKHRVNYQLKESKGKLTLLIHANESKKNWHTPQETGMFIIDPQSGTVYRAKEDHQ